MMNVSDKCPICQSNMTKKDIIQLVPCKHFYHTHCWASNVQLGQNGLDCALCRVTHTGTTPFIRRKNTSASLEDRRRFVEAARDLRDWKGLAFSMQVKEKTAWRWIRDDQDAPKSRRNTVRAALSTANIDELIQHLETDPSLTLVQLREFVFSNFAKTLSTSTIANYLHGRVFSHKKVHYQPQGTNEPSRKLLRKEFVEAMIIHIAASK